MLSGQSVGLRAIEIDDLSQLMDWRNQPNLRKYFREHKEINLFKQQQWFESRVLSDPNTLMFAIVDAKSLALLGACGLCYIDWINRSADFSIYIGKDSLYIDDKFASDAAHVLIKYAFEEINLHRLWCEIYEFDSMKKNMLEQLHFKLDGRHRETHWFDGKWNDSLFYGLLKNDIPS